MTEPEALLELQNTDLRIMRIQNQLQQMPQQKHLSDIIRAQKKLAGQLNIIVGQRKDLQMELDDNEAAHAEIIAKTAQVKDEAAQRAVNFRQTRDLEAQLSSLAKRQEKLEFENAQLTAQLERAQTAEKNARAISERLVSERENTERSFEQATSDLRAQLRQLQARHKALLNDLSPKISERYVQASKRFSGLGVESVELTRDAVSAPSICRVSLQASLVDDIRRGSGIIDCPYCHRMLVVRRADA